MKTFVVGDIHGGLKALKQVLDKVPYTTKDQFIFLGDYVDGWSDSAGTIDFLIDFSKNHKAVFIRGNHDYLLTQYLDRYSENPLWLNSGGTSTIASYKGYSTAQKQRHLQFLLQLENYFIDTANNLYVHAGFTNQHGIAHEYYPNLVYWDRTLWEMACAMDKSLSPKSKYYPLRLKNYKEIFIGHTPTTKLDSTKPLNRANVWNIDTGAAFKGPLTIIDVDSKIFWQSDPVWEHYPNESGRN